MKINVDNLQGEIIRDNETYIVEDNAYLNGLTVSKTTLYPTKKTGGHGHAGIDEVYYFVRGEGMILIDDEEFLCEAGDIFMIPGGAFHQVRNIGETNLEFVCVFQKYSREDKK